MWATDSGKVSNLNGTGRGVEEALLTTLMTSFMKFFRGMPEEGGAVEVGPCQRYIGGERVEWGRAVSGDGSDDGEPSGAGGC